MKTLPRLFALCTTLALLPDIALACGGGWAAPEGTPAEQVPYSSSSRVILEWEDTLSGPVTVAIQSDVQNASTGFAFVIPVPQLPEEDELGVVDARIFDQLMVQTGPRTVDIDCSEFGSGTRLTCPDPAESGGTDGGDGGGEDEGGDYEGVDPGETWTVGLYEVTTVAAEDPQGLAGYLQDQGLEITGDTADILADYVENNWSFLVIRVPDEAVPEDGERLPGLRFRLDGGLQTLPLMLGAAGNPETQDLFLFTFLPAEAAVGISNIDNLDMETECMFREDDLGQAFQDAFAADHANAGTAVVRREYHRPQYYDGRDLTTQTDPFEYGTFERNIQNNLAYSSTYSLGRLHLRFAPGELTVDPAFYRETTDGGVEPQFHPFQTELTSNVPVCGEGIVAEGSCPETIWDDSYCTDDREDKHPQSCSTTPGKVSLGIALLAVCAAVGRRRGRG